MFSYAAFWLISDINEFYKQKVIKAENLNSLVSYQTKIIQTSVITCLALQILC